VPNSFLLFLNFGEFYSFGGKGSVFWCRIGSVSRLQLMVVVFYFIFYCTDTVDFLKMGTELHCWAGRIR
jgi:hypothetical protein